MKVAILFLFVASAVAKLPSYIKPCSRADPAINKCFVENGNNCLETLTRGDESIQIPAVFPVLKHPGAKYDPNDEFSFELKDIDVTGMDTIKLVDAKIDFEKKTIWFQFKFVTIDAIGSYTAKAKNVNDEVTDKSHITFYGNEYTAIMNFDIKDEHIIVKNIDVEFTKEPKVDFELNSLDKHEEIKALWAKEMPGFLKVGNKAMGEFLNLIFSNVFKAATYDEIFPPKV